MLDTTQTTTVQMTAGELHSALSAVKHAMSREETRYYLCGVYVHGDEKATHFVATDGHRLARATVTVAMPFKGAILSRDFVAAALKATSKRSRQHHSVILAFRGGKSILDMN